MALSLTNLEGWEIFLRTRTKPPIALHATAPQNLTLDTAVVPGVGGMVGADGTAVATVAFHEVVGRGDAEVVAALTMARFLTV